MDTVRFGVIGLGNMGSLHSTMIFQNQVPGAVLAAVCDTNPAKITWAKEQFGEKVKCFDSADALFASGSVDAVMLATPHYDHPVLAIEAFKQGLNVLVEKPAGVYVSQVEEMNQAAKKSGKLFGIMYNQRTLGQYQKLRDLVSSGELGNIKRIQWTITDWYRTQAYYNSGGWRASWRGEGGGTLINQCPHNIDLWQWICGMPQRVRAFCSFGKYHTIEVEDDVTAYFEYANGATGVFIASTGEFPGTNRLEIAADRGKAVLEGGQLTFFRTRVPVDTHCRTTTEAWGTPECWNCQVPFGGGEQHKGIFKDFTTALLKGTPLLAPGEEGVNCVTLINAMLMSSWTNDVVSLPLDNKRYRELLEERIKTSTYKK